MPLDCVSGYTLPQIESCLRTATNLSQLKSKLRQFYNGTSYFLDELFAQFENMQPAPTPAATVFQKGAILQAGTLYYSPNQRYCVVFQGDGNLVVYDTYPSSWVPVWHSRTYGRGGTLCIFQSDGNLVIYNKQSQPLWATNTYPYGYSLAVEDNGALIIYRNSAPTMTLWANFDDYSTAF